MTNALNLDGQNQTAADPYLEQLVAFIRMNAGMERDFGPAGALLRYGEEFEPAANHPKWFTHGAAKQCFDNVTQVLISRTTAGDTSVRYAEGYAMDAELPIPMLHSWLVDADNKVIDPTWRDVADNLYFGIVFKTKFVLDLLQIKKSTGILIDHAAMRRHYGTTELFESGIYRLATP